MKKRTTIQTLIFDKAKFPTRDSVRKWIKAHGFHIMRQKEKVTKPGIDETAGSFRVRQRAPSDFVRGSFRTINITDGVKAVIGRLKSSVKKTGVVLEVKGPYDLLDILEELCGD